MKKKMFDYIVVIIGLLLLVSGLYLMRLHAGVQNVLLTLPYVFIGVGCGIFGHGMGNVIGRKVLKGNPEIKKQMDIDKNDERNIAISNRAKAKAYDLMIFVYGALMVSLSLMNVGLTVVLLLVCAYLFVVGYGVYYRFKFDKEM